MRLRAILLYMNPSTDQPLPGSLAPYFQEYNFQRIDPEQHADLVIERVLAYGDRNELRWLFRRYNRQHITDWILHMGARRLPWRRYNLWCVLLSLPPARRFREDNNRIWPY